MSYEVGTYIDLAGLSGTSKAEVDISVPKPEPFSHPARRLFDVGTEISFNQIFGGGLVARRRIPVIFA